MKEQLLFDDSETFVKERPNITERQKDEIYVKLAMEIIKTGWSADDEIKIIHDLRNLHRIDTGYEMAKQLESCSSQATYDIDSEFIQWLESFYSHFDDIKYENVRRWVKARNIKPKYKKGDKLKVVTRWKGAGFKDPDDIIYITGFHEDLAEYLYDKDKDHKGGYVTAYETIENNCILLPE